MKQKLQFILLKTIFFACIVGYIIGFGYLFGESNKLIGVAGITATLMFLNRNLTSSLKRSTLFFCAFYVFLGLCAYITTTSVTGGVIATFVSVFMIGYLFSSYFYKATYIAFGLAYIFMVLKPVTLIELPTRLAALVAAALTLVIVQFFINRQTFIKNTHQLLSTIYEKLSQFDLEVEETVNSLLMIIRDHKNELGELTKKSMNVLNEVIVLERLILQLNTTFEDNEKEILSTYFKLLAKSHQTKVSISEDELNERINVLKNRPDLIQTLKVLTDATNEVMLNQQLKEERLPSRLCYKTFVDQLKKERTTLSIRYVFGIRLGVALTVGIFIWQYFELSEGGWIAYTLLSLTTPLYEQSMQKMKDRLGATMIGAIITYVLFTVITDASMYPLIILLAGYVGSFMTTYKANVYCVTVSAIAVAVVGTSTPVVLLIMTRLVYVGVGALLTLFIAKAIYAYTELRRVGQLKYHYLRQLDELTSLVQSPKINVAEINELYLKVRMLSTQIKMYNQLSESVHINLQQTQEFIHQLIHVMADGQHAMTSHLINSIQSAQENLHHLMVSNQAYQE